MYPVYLMFSYIRAISYACLPNFIIFSFCLTLHSLDVQYMCIVLRQGIATK